MPPKRNIYSNNRDTITNRLKRVVGESQYAEKKAKKDLKIKSRKSMVALNEKTPNMMALEQMSNVANLPVGVSGQLSATGSAKKRRNRNKNKTASTSASPLPNVSTSALTASPSTPQAPKRFFSQSTTPSASTPSASSPQVKRQRKPPTRFSPKVI